VLVQKGVGRITMSDKVYLLQKSTESARVVNHTQMHARAVHNARYL